MPVPALSLAVSLVTVGTTPERQFKLGATVWVNNIAKNSYLTKLGVVATQSNQLLTDGTTSIGLPLALLGVTDDSLHLMTTWKATVSVTTLRGVHKTLDASLNALLSCFLRVAGIGGISTTTIKIKAKLLHLVGVTILLVATNTQIKVLTHCTMISGLHRLGTSVTGVHKLVLTLLKKIFRTRSFW